MNKGIKNDDYFSVFLYTSFLEREQKDMRYCTTAEKFKRDICQILKSGYQPISLKDFYNLKHNAEPSSPKYFSIVMLGGYSDNYTIAFPILKKMNIPASIFLCTDLVGKENYPGIDSFTPHFGWNAAREMHQSGLIDIYAMWHQFDHGKDLKKTAKEKIEILNKELRSKDLNFAFYYLGIDEVAVKALSELGISVIITNKSPKVDESLQIEIIASINVEYYTEILDAVSRNEEICKDLLRKTEELRGLSDFEIVIKEKYKYFDLPSISLPINRHPMIRNYLHHAFPLSVLETRHRDRVERWVLNEYIEVVFAPLYNWFDYHNILYPHWDSLNCYTITTEIIKISQVDIIDFIIHSLHEGYYCDIWLDTYYILHKHGYLKTHRSHGVLIYGYDNAKKVFLVLSYTNRDVYEEFEAAICDVAMACASPYFAEIKLLKINDGCTIPYNIHVLRDRLYRYINSIVQDDFALKYIKPDVGNYYNFNATEYFANSLYSHSLKERYIHQTSIYSFSEHKRCMAWRIQYICEMEGIYIDNSDVDSFLKNTNRDCEYLIKISIKYNLKKQEQLLLTVSDFAKKLVRQERKTILWLIEKIDNKYNESK